MSFVTITLEMAVHLVILTIYIIWLYHKHKNYVVPKFIHTLVHVVRTWKCPNNKINHCDQYQAKECGQQTDKNYCAENETALKQYSNKELADLFYYVLFLVFTFLYILLFFSVSVLMSSA